MTSNYDAEYSWQHKDPAPLDPYRRDDVYLGECEQYPDCRGSLEYKWSRFCTEHAAERIAVMQMTPAEWAEHCEAQFAARRKVEDNATSN